ncbi:F-box domain [Musa troglodytarum]|uniref:F-box domain n=1 Tax=Musa troglodytarum TaxID=320322 RepID=A0A9E7EC56_9LILI|nr:F-box domain [Musa troglodytarum]
MSVDQMTVESPSKLHFVWVSFCLVFGGDAYGCSRRAEVVLNELAMRPLDSRREAQDEACGGGGEGGREGSATPPALRAPGHLIARVFSQLDCVDLLNCALVCKCAVMPPMAVPVINPRAPTGRAVEFLLPSFDTIRSVSVVLSPSSMNAEDPKKKPKWKRKKNLFGVAQFLPN